MNTSRAERIAELRKRCSADTKFLLAELDAAEAKLQRIRELHRPFGIYSGDCGHTHESTDEPGVVEIEDIGLTCAKLYDICYSCCRYDDGQSEVCYGEHVHGPSAPVCATAAILEGEQ